MTDGTITVRLAERGDATSLLDVLPQISSRPDSLSATTLGVEESHSYLGEPVGWSGPAKRTPISASWRIGYARHWEKGDALFQGPVLDAAVANDDWKTILTKCPVRESTALDDISAALGFRKMQDYEKAVRYLLAEDDNALAFVRGLFDNLFDQMQG